MPSRLNSECWYSSLGKVFDSITRGLNKNNHQGKAFRTSNNDGVQIWKLSSSMIAA